MADFSLFTFLRLVLAVFAAIYAGSWLVAMALAGLPRRSAGGERGGPAGRIARLRGFYGPRLGRDAAEIAALVVVLVFLIGLHGWR